MYAVHRSIHAYLCKLRIGSANMRAQLCEIKYKIGKKKLNVRKIWLEAYVFPDSFVRLRHRGSRPRHCISGCWVCSSHPHSGIHHCDIEVLKETTEKSQMKSWPNRAILIGQLLYLAYLFRVRPIVTGLSPQLLNHTLPQPRFPNSCVTKKDEIKTNVLLMKMKKKSSKKDNVQIIYWIMFKAA